MDKFPIYSKIFEQKLPEILTDAVNHLMKEHVVKTMSVVAKKTNISLPTLNGYMSGKNHISNNFIENFRVVFSIDLCNPVSFKEDTFLTNIEIAGLPDIPASSFIIIFNTLRQQIRAQQMINEGLKKTNEGLDRSNRELYNYILMWQPERMKAILGVEK